MIELKKLLFLLIYLLIVGSVLISGCTEQENAVTDITSSQSTDRRDYENQQYEYQQELLKDIERFNDPLLKNVKVEINNPNIELISLKLNDDRAYETDSNWYVEIIVQNNAKTPVWILPGLVGVTEEKSPQFMLLDSGERKKYAFVGSQMKPKRDIDYVLTNALTVEIYAHETVMPKISSDFVYNYREITHLAGNNYGPLLNLKSLTYEINDKKWRYATFEMHNPSAFQLNGAIQIHITGESSDYYESRDNSFSFTINPGENKDIQISLRDYDSKDIRTIYLYTYAPS